MEIMKDALDQAQLVHTRSGGDVGSEAKGQLALMSQLEQMGYVVETEKQLTITVLREAKPPPKDRIDLLINKKVLVELKYSNDIVKAHSQVRRYLTHPNMAKICKHAVLIGFPKKRLDQHLVLCHSAIWGKDFTGVEGVQFNQTTLKPRPAILKRCLHS